VNRFGRETTAEEVARSADLSGRLAVVTGASSGIGVETARALAGAGADVVLGVRDVVAGETVARAIADETTGAPRVMALDLRELSSVADFADRIEGPVDLLIANAGVSKTPDAHLPNGLDVRFATNHLGHFMLALRLRAQMAERGARIVVVSSGAHHNMPVRLDDLQWHGREHHAGMAYAESKSANILFAQEASRRWGPEGIFANAVLPGSSLTGLQRFHGEEPDPLMALAMAVRAGFTAPMLGKKLVSTTYRLSSSWALQLTSSTEVARGSVAEPAGAGLVGHAGHGKSFISCRSSCRGRGGRPCRM
jgi:NAD(P)-dependent dehydrogenase (short-subunit alcohol dehydrogenase family)